MDAGELRYLNSIVHDTAKQAMSIAGTTVDYLLGTMIETPRAALTAEQLAGSARFFSFGTNDLTQMTLGLSRDDASTFLPDYLNKRILDGDPFQSIDQRGVGVLMRRAVEAGRAARRGLKCGICGEHGGDPASIAFCHQIRLDYISCSPYRLPIARLAAAQAAIKDKAAKKNKK
jgi:pyruvate,orthophosphate dikinase